MFVFSLEKFLEVEFLDYMVVLFLIFWEIFRLSSIVVVPIYIPINCAWRFTFLHILIVCVCFFAQLCPPFCNSLNCSCQAPLSMGFSRQEYWSGLPCPSGDFPDPGIKPTSPVSCFAGEIFTHWAMREANLK